MIAFQIASDLHIEYKNNDVPDPLSLITPVADYLILAGDIGSFYKINQLQKFLTELCKHFVKVFYIPGNQEYYMFKEYKPLPFDYLLKRMYEIENNINNLFILNRSSIIINDICITGCTLWSKPEIEIPKYIVRINGINNKIYEENHKSDLMYIEKMIDYTQNNNLKLLVVTHYCPTYKVLENTKRKDKYISLYVSNLDNLLTSEKVNTWVCGHIHKNFDFFTENGTRVVGNQKGKQKDKINDFYKNFTVNI
jgi:predicted phosphohydrolase